MKVSKKLNFWFRYGVTISVGVLAVCIWGWNAWFPSLFSFMAGGLFAYCLDIRAVRKSDAEFEARMKSLPFVPVPVPKEAFDHIIDLERERKLRCPPTH